MSLNHMGDTTVDRFDGWTEQFTGIDLSKRKSPPKLLVGQRGRQQPDQQTNKQPKMTLSRASDGGP